MTMSTLLIYVAFFNTLMRFIRMHTYKIIKKNWILKNNDVQLVSFICFWIMCYVCVRGRFNDGAMSLWCFMSTFDAQVCLDWVFRDWLRCRHHLLIMSFDCVKWKKHILLEFRSDWMKGVTWKDLHVRGR